MPRWHRQEQDEPLTEKVALLKQAAGTEMDKVGLGWGFFSLYVLLDVVTPINA